ncbi:MAG: hypothetical protein HFH45_01830 [Bacilli bacterium]|nr:hypothetical protein [Bacilli bacterium]
MKKTNVYDRWMKFFQSRVFDLEMIKFKVQDRLVPNYDRFVEKRIKKGLNKKLEKAKTEDERLLDVNCTKFSILEIRKEKHRKENMNYHLDIDNPEKTLFWLNKNKDIHKRGLKKNFIKIPIIIILLIGSNMSIFSNFNAFVSVISILGLIVESLSTFINANCILLQNYNIKRVNKYIEGPYQKRKKRLQKRAEEYHEVTSIVSRKVQEGDNIPSIDEVLAGIQTSAQAKLLLDLVKKEISYRDSSLSQRMGVKTKSL